MYEFVGAIGYCPGPDIAWDCGSGERSDLYWTIGPPTGDAGYRFIEYWAFYRYNHYDLSNLPDWNHEGDWEAVAIAPTQRGVNYAGAFDFASFSEHDRWFSYLRANLQCITSSGSSCGTDTAPLERRLKVYIAQGSHGNYPYACTECDRDGGLGTGDPVFDEMPHDGLDPWGNNATGPEGLEELPLDAGTWGTWPGRWGATYGDLPSDSKSPHGPAFREGFGIGGGTIECADDNDGCPVPRRAQARLGPDRTAERCRTWLGGGVSAAACIEPELRSAVRAGQLRNKRGTFRRVVVTDAGQRLRAARAPGIAQVMGAPLRAGSLITIETDQRSRVTLLIRVRRGGSIVAESQLVTPGVFRVTHQGLVRARR